jgi:hypothetical protein
MLGAITILSDTAAAFGTPKLTRIKVVGDGAYVAGGSVGFADLFNTAVGETREILSMIGDGQEGDVHLEYTPRGPSVVATAVAATDLITTVTPQPLNAAAVPVAHGFAAGDPVEFRAVKNGTNANLPDGKLPSPLAEVTVYYVIASGLTTTAFKVSATSGGSAIDLTDAGAGRWTVRKSDRLFTRDMAAGTEDTTADQSGRTYTLFVTSK